MVIIPEPPIQAVEGTDYYHTYEEYRITILGKEIVIPKGFVFDGASIPAAFWISFYTPYHPRVIAAALVHDFLYYSHLATKEEADKIFGAILGAKGVGKFRRRNMWRAVHLFGGRAWERRSQFGLKA